MPEVAILEDVVKSPVNRYPGSKGKKKVLSILEANAIPRAAILEPFAGAAHYSISRLQKGSPFAMLGETCPTIRALYRVWGVPLWHGLFAREIDKIIDNLRQDADATIAVLNAAIKSAWNDQGGKLAMMPVGIDLIRLAAVGAIARQLTFGGIIRRGAGGQQSAPVVGCQLDKVVKGWLPPLAGSLTAKKLRVWPNYNQAISRMMMTDYSGAVEAIIDPPYYIPRDEVPRRKSAAYWAHQPHESITRDLCTTAFKAVLADDRVIRVVICNHYSDELNGLLSKIAADHQCDLTLNVDGEMRSMQRATGAYDDSGKQAFWELHR